MCSTWTSDNFKHLNDTLGHHAGDQLLVGLAELLRRSTRDVDLVARQSGDEFLILLADLDPIDAPGVIALVLERIVEALQVPSIPRRHGVPRAWLDRHQ